MFKMTDVSVAINLMYYPIKTRFETGTEMQVRFWRSFAKKLNFRRLGLNLLFSRLYLSFMSETILRKL